MKLDELLLPVQQFAPKLPRFLSHLVVCASVNESKTEQLVSMNLHACGGAYMYYPKKSAYTALFTTVYINTPVLYLNCSVPQSMSFLPEASSNNVLYDTRKLAEWIRKYFQKHRKDFFFVPRQERSPEALNHGN